MVLYSSSSKSPIMISAISHLRIVVLIPFFSVIISEAAVIEHFEQAVLDASYFSVKNVVARKRDAPGLQHEKSVTDLLRFIHNKHPPATTFQRV